MSFLIAEAHAQAGQAPAAGPGAFNFLLLAGLLVFMYLIIIRPQRKQMKEHRQMMESLEVGNEVVTTGGIIGKIVKLQDDYVVVRASDTVELKFQKNAIHSVLPKGTIKEINK